MKNERVRLVLLSFLMLFLELALIRWAGANVVYLSYFSNFLLLGSFLGIGIGFLRGGERRPLFPYAPPMLAVLVLLISILPVEISRSGSDYIFFGSFYKSGLPSWVMLPALFLGSAAVMAAVADGVARSFRRFPPLEAYRLDILGSIAGIAGFTILSFTGAPPAVWGAAVAALFAILLTRFRLLQVVSLVVVVGALTLESMAATDLWSPYYRVSAARQLVGDDPAVDVKVNGIPHQSVQPTAHRRLREAMYFLPYERISEKDLRDVLVIGAGTGSDVAIALDEGARRVDAVEIDPLLYRLGKAVHPDAPYDDPRVTVHIDDGRAFLERSDRRYDLILFALPDSLTLVSGQSSLRLESYLFTKEALEAARERLKPDGAFSMYNYYREPWLIDRLALTLNEVFDQPPCLDAAGGEAGMAVLTASNAPAALRCAGVWSPSSNYVPPPATDDYPFLYLRHRSIPSLYLVTIALIVLLSLIAVRGAAGRLRPFVGYADLFLMGAAFLLLETKSVVQFALLFGTTWVVNSLVFGGILLSVYAAVEVSRRIEFSSTRALQAALVASIAIAWVVPQKQLLQLPVSGRFAAAAALAFAPVFLANLIFAQRFKTVASSTAAFGANLLGAMAGGLVEYASLMVGYRSLLLVVGGLYIGAFIVSGRYASVAHLRARLAGRPIPAAP